MTPTDELIQQHQAENILAMILEDLRESHVDTPILHVVTAFPTVTSVLTVYDKFVAIQEYNDDEKELYYVAVGHNIGDKLSDGLFELVDIRQLDDSINFIRAIRIFTEYTDNHKPHITRVITEVGDRGDQIIGNLLDSWKLASEIDASGGWH